MFSQQFKVGDAVQLISRNKLYPGTVVKYDGRCRTYNVEFLPTGEYPRGIPQMNEISYDTLIPHNPLLNLALMEMTKNPPILKCAPASLPKMDLSAYSKATIEYEYNINVLYNKLTDFESQIVSERNTIYDSYVKKIIKIITNQCDGAEGATI
jgi:hypothetical protein